MSAFLLPKEIAIFSAAADLKTASDVNVDIIEVFEAQYSFYVISCILEDDGGILPAFCESIDDRR